MNYTSRSAIELTQKCKRARFLQYHYKGRGISLATANVDLSIGTAVHAGVEILMTAIKNDDFYTLKSEVDPWVEKAVNWGITVIRCLLKENEVSEEFHAEIVAIVEVLIRLWAIQELPRIRDNFNVLWVEKELAVPLADDLILESRADALLQSKEDDSIYVYSLKTAREFGYKVERTYRKDLQGVTETWAAEFEIKKRNAEASKLVQMVIESETNGVIGYEKDYLALLKWIDEKARLWQDRVSGVMFCYLIKGKKRKETYTDSDFENGGEVSEVAEGYTTQNPFLYGYRKWNAGSAEYAHSKYFPNPDNKSGKGMLGKGWERFPVFSDYEGGVKKWIEDVCKGEIQKDCPNPIVKHVITPPPVFRREGEIIETMDELVYKELETYHFLKNLIEDETTGINGGYAASISRYFPRTLNRGNCFWPSVCEYTQICWGEDFSGQPVSPEIADDPVGSGAYKWREPHHKLEKERVEKLVQIEVSNAG